MPMPSTCEDALTHDMAKIRTCTQYAAAALFLFFGVRMLRDGCRLDHAGASEELEEVEAELTKKQVHARVREIFKCMSVPIR